MSEARFFIAADHPAFAGHFPGRPIVPGVVLLDQALHAIAKTTGLPVESGQLSQAKFLSPVGPASELLVHFELTASGSIRFEVLHSERRVASGIVAPGTTPCKTADPS